MKIDYDVGDVVVKHIAGIDAPRGVISRCIGFYEHPQYGICALLDRKVRGHNIWLADHWKKLPKADAGFTSLIKRKAAPKRVPENA